MDQAPARRAPKDIGLGLLALILCVVGVITGLIPKQTWFIWIVSVLFLLGIINCFVIGKRWSGIGWLINAICFFAALYFFGRWGALIGVVAAYFIATPIVNKKEVH